MTTITVPNTGIRDATRVSSFWRKDQLFGHSTNGQYVPNVGDLSFDPIAGFEIVTEVFSDGKSTLTPWTIPPTGTVSTETSKLLATGPGSADERFRAFLDTSVTPNVIAPDSSLHLYGSDVEYYKLFIGSDISSTGRVIAFVRDTNGNIVGENIPFDAYVIEGETNPTIKVPKPAYTTEPLATGDVVSLVSYSKEGRERSIDQLIVRKSGATRYLEASRRYVNGIAIESSSLSSGDPSVIEFPVNVPVQQLPMNGVVYYSDGSKDVIPLDGNRMTLEGIDNYSATVAGEEFRLVLVYNLSTDEVSYDQVPTTDRKVTKIYTARTTEANDAYSVKLFVYPVWDTSAEKYRLDYWLYNVDRQNYYNVTPLIELGSNSVGFDPTEYGTIQTITVAVDLNRVDPKFKSMRHFQRFQVTLINRGSEQASLWQVKFRPDQTASFGGYTAKLSQGSVNAWTIDISNSEASQQTWLTHLFYGVEPLYNSATESKAPEPTHFRIVTLHNKYERRVDQWDQAFEIVNDLEQGNNIYLEWIYRTDTTDLQLGITALPVMIN